MDPASRVEKVGSRFSTTSSTGSTGTPSDTALRAARTESKHGDVDMLPTFNAGVELAPVNRDGRQFSHGHVQTRGGFLEESHAEDLLPRLSMFFLLLSACKPVTQPFHCCRYDS